MNPIENYESEVRGYCRDFPVSFDRARGAWLYDEKGTAYLDFFAGAGALNYGHNHPELQQALVNYIQACGITHSLDMFTRAKREFLEALNEIILAPRQMNYKVQFPGPTGTNAVEAALKLARKVTCRERIVAFTNSFHGMTLGALSVTGNTFKRAGAGVPLTNSVSLPFDGYLGTGHDSLAYLEAMLKDAGSGMDKPAAVILETIQAEGGVNVARFEWLKQLSALLKRHGILLIVDDIQVGCGRTGPFFSFEPAGIKPDIICLSKSLSGYGLPLSIVLIKPEHDVWSPGEHNGTFRGHNPAFVTAKTALELFWRDNALRLDVERKSAQIKKYLGAIATRFDALEIKVKGRGMIQGLSFNIAEHASQVAETCFEQRLIIETAGVESQILKLLPALTISDADLQTGLEIIEKSIAALDKSLRRNAA